MVPNIRVDQSHCNNRLALRLGELGWNVVFRDPGRASRGRAGSQALTLSVFTRNNWPIPDIVAYHGTKALLIEVDRTIGVTIGSAAAYQSHEAALLKDLTDTGQAYARLDRLEVGFCRTGLGSLSAATVQVAREHGFTVLAYFMDPMQPIIVQLSD